MRNVVLSLCLFCTVAVNAAVDLEQTMKNMGFQFKQAIEMSDSSQLLPVLDELIILTLQAQQGPFADDKAEQFRQGLVKVHTELVAAKAAAQRDDMATAQQHLRQVEALRKEYHKQRKVSFWQLLFG
ncbi:cytochrome b562 [Rheinheimera muenzenbergensis]|uniref:Cytochrome b562 n=1 Tax=Rheinheimera muenzenbergensis TaxID=1193628 RepID=A0ABU8C8M0_9GAMM